MERGQKTSQMNNVKNVKHQKLTSPLTSTTVHTTTH